MKYIFQVFNPTTLFHLQILAFIFVVGIFLNKVIFSLILKKNNQVHIRFIKSIIEVIFFSVIFYCCLAEISVVKDLGKTLLQSSALLLAIATFAAQKVLANIISGISISAARPFNIGDKIIVTNNGSVLSEGIVTDINIRHTIIQKFDGRCDIIPNGVIDECVITNSDKIKVIGTFLEVEIGYDADVDLACEVMRNIILSHPLTVNESATTSVLVKGFSQNGVLLKGLVKTANLNDSFKGCSDIRKEILKQFNENNITIPYQTVTIIQS